MAEQTATPTNPEKLAAAVVRLITAGNARIEDVIMAAYDAHLVTPEDRPTPEGQRLMEAVRVGHDAGPDDWRERVVDGFIERSMEYERERRRGG